MTPIISSPAVVKKRSIMKARQQMHDARSPTTPSLDPTQDDPGNRAQVRKAHKIRKRTKMNIRNYQLASFTETDRYKKTEDCVQPDRSALVPGRNLEGQVHTQQDIYSQQPLPVFGSFPSQNGNDVNFNSGQPLGNISFNDFLLLQQQQASCENGMNPYHDFGAGIDQSTPPSEAGPQIWYPDASGGTGWPSSTGNEMDSFEFTAGLPETDGADGILPQELPRGVPSWTTHQPLGFANGSAHNDFGRGSDPNYSPLAHWFNVQQSMQYQSLAHQARVNGPSTMVPTGMLQDPQGNQFFAPGDLPNHYHNGEYGPNSQQHFV